MTWMMRMTWFWLLAMSPVMKPAKRPEMTLAKTLVRRPLMRRETHTVKMLATRYGTLNVTNSPNRMNLNWSQILSRTLSQNQRRRTLGTAPLSAWETVAASFAGPQ